MALPSFRVRHFDAVAVVSAVVDGQLRVLASSDARFGVGEPLVNAREAMRALGAGQTAIGPESGVGDGLSCMCTWPLVERQSTIGVLQLMRSVPFNETSILTQEIFAGLISSRLTEASRSREATVAAELVMALAEAESMAEATRAALELLAGYADAEAGYVLQAMQGQMVPLANIGFEPGEERARQLGIGEYYPTGLAWQACIEKRSMVLPVTGSEQRPLRTPVTLVEPLGWRDHYRYVLIMRLRPRDVFSPADEAALSMLCTQLELGLERLQMNLLQDRLLELQADVVNADADGIYQKIIDVAVSLVPGASAGSLLVRSNNAEPFVFRAVNGFDPLPLRDVRLTEENMQSWYGMDRAAWVSGNVREMRVTNTDIKQASQTSSGKKDSTVPGAELIKASLCLPVSFRGDVLAFMNLDNLHRAEAFGEDSVRALKMFTPVVGSMLGAVREWTNIVQVAHTDALTGLPNRRGFDVALDAQLRNAEKHGQEFVLCILDLKNFKQVNDTHGHKAGDAALCRVAELMRGNARETDTVSRWGGDEFALLLPGAGHELAEQITGRVREAVTDIVIGDIALDVHVGIACYPIDSTSGSELLQIADSRMYASKLGNRHNSHFS